MTDFSKSEVLAAIDIAAGQAAEQANYLDDPGVIALNHGTKAEQVKRLDRRAAALQYARELVEERWRG